AQLVAASEPVAGTRLLELEASEPLGFTGGQYIIVDTGLVLPNGKAVKRAYSIMSAEGEQRRLRLAVTRIPGGPGSAFLHEAPVGTTLKFSGPWGKLMPDGSGGATAMLATDTGIT